MKGLLVMRIVIKAAFWVGLFLSPCCGMGGPERHGQPSEKAWQESRLRMVREQIERRGVGDALVLAAMKKVPRHLFVPEEYLSGAYRDSPLPIASGQTISQPYIVAYMTELLHLDKTSKVLEIGTGSGYQAAVLAEIAKEVYSIEIIAGLQKEAAVVLSRIGYGNIHLKVGDGYVGWAEHAPFDGIIVTAAPDHIPQPLKRQLKIGGRLVIPVGKGFQELLVITRATDGFHVEQTIPVRFVPMTGEAQQGESE